MISIAEQRTHMGLAAKDVPEVMPVNMRHTHAGDGTSSSLSSQHYAGCPVDLYVVWPYFGNAMTEREYTVSGFMMPDEPGMNLLRDQPAQPFLLRTQLPDRRWRSARWWLTRWWPKRLRVWFCYWYGHPSRCMERYSTTEVVAVDDTMVNGEPSWTFEATGTYCRVDECCHLCGWEHHVQF